MTCLSYMTYSRWVDAHINVQLFSACNVTFYTYVTPPITQKSPNNSTHPYHRIELHIRDQKVATWSSHDGIYLVVLNETCAVQQRREFHVLKEASHFLDTVPNETILVGLTTGVNGKLLQWKLGFKIKLKFRNYFLPFVVRKGYPGLGNYDVQHLGGLQNHTWSRPIYKGQPCMSSYCHVYHTR